MNPAPENFSLVLETSTASTNPVIRMMLGQGLVNQGAEKEQVRVLIHLLVRDPNVDPAIMESVLRNAVPRPRMGQKVKK